MFPYLDLPSFTRRTPLPSQYVEDVESSTPGYTAQSISIRSSQINARLRKRYGNTGQRSSLPFGQVAPTLLPAGTAPPAVTLSGRPTMGAYLMVIQVTTPGTLGTAQVKWSSDGGVTFTGPVATAPAVTLGPTGMTATFPGGTYSADNNWTAATPCPEAVLGWLTSLVSVDVLRKRGVNSNDPAITMVFDEAKTALDQIREAADGKDGLFDLPQSEDQDSAITTGGPLGYSEQSPYVWMDQQARAGGFEDGQGRGSF